MKLQLVACCLVFFVSSLPRSNHLLLSGGVRFSWFLAFFAASLLLPKSWKHKSVAICQNNYVHKKKGKSQIKRKGKMETMDANYFGILLWFLSHLVLTYFFSQTKVYKKKWRGIFVKRSIWWCIRTSVSTFYFCSTKHRTKHRLKNFLSQKNWLLDNFFKLFFCKIDFLKL